jgi:hypothetical protein
MKNHLFIGLGGQGGRSLAELRKVIHQRQEDERQLNQEGVRWDYLYVDSSENVANTRSNWTHFGVNLQLQPSQILNLRQGGALPDVDSLAIRPEIAPWIGDPAILKGWLQGANSIEGANQKRRFGRLLFAGNANRAIAAVSQKVTELTAARPNRCASLAGGTGSGTIIDVITMLRTKYPNAAVDNGFPIFLYLYITSDDDKGANVGYFYQNQYAALRDINALAAGRLHPTLLNGNGEKFSQQTPINGIVLSSSVSDLGMRHSLERQIKTVSEAAFERLYCFCSGNLDEDAQNGITGQDLLAIAKGEPLLCPERSFRFGTLGMRRWEIPTETIQELVANEIYVFAFRQMLYENWQDGEGYQDSEKAGASSEANALLEKLRANFEKLLISRYDLPQLQKKFTEDADKVLQGVLRQGLGDAGLQDLQETVRNHYETVFASGGIGHVFSDFAARQSARLEGAVANIHEAISDAWTSNSTPLGFSKIPKVLMDFQRELRQMIEKGLADSGSENQRVDARLRARLDEWNKITGLSALAGKRTQLAVAHLADARSRCLDDMRGRALAEDRRLVDKLVAEVSVLEQKYRNSMQKLQEFKMKVHDRKEILWAGLRDMQTPADANKYEVDLDALVLFVQLARQDKEQMRNTCESLRPAIVEACGGSILSTFAGLKPERLELLWTRMDEHCYARVKGIHDQYHADGKMDPILGSSLLDVLQSHSQQDGDKLRREMQEFLNNAAACLEVNRSERQVFHGNESRFPRHHFIIGLPRNHPFAADLRNMVLDLTPSGLEMRIGEYEHDDPTQVRLLVIYCWMAARVAPVVAELEQKYKQATQGNHVGDVIYHANIDPKGHSERASLLAPTPEQLRNALKANFWLANRLRVGQPPQALIQENAQGAYLILQEDGVVTPQKIGASLEMFETTADTNKMALVHSAVSAVVGDLGIDQRKPLLDEIKVEDAKLLEQWGVLAPEYMAWTQIRDELNKRLAQ